MALTRLLHAGLLGLHVQGDCGPLTIYHAQTGRHVYFDKAPPLTPPSPAQTLNRNQFRYAGRCWQALTQHQRNDWETLSRRASAKMTGYNIFTWWLRTRDDSAIDTLIRQTGASDPR